MSEKEYSKLPSGASKVIQAYKIQIPTQKIQQLKTLVEIAPIGPITYENVQEDRKWGITRDWLAETRKFWLEKFDW
jgi:microsomal epoxide hydrolase